MLMVLDRFFSGEHGEHLERVACPSCGRDDAADYRVSHDRLFGRPGRYHVVRCRLCGMMYTNPRPTFESLSRHYPQDYFCYDPPERLTGLRRLVLGSAIRKLANRRVRMLENVAGRLTPGTRVCDVGCSYGQLLTVLREERGCEVLGVDFSEAMVECCRQNAVPVAQGTLQEAGFDDGRFDVVTMTEYLEHEGKPLDVLAECRRVTRPGGLLAVEVPLISAIAPRLFGRYWSQLDLPRHLMFFTPQTLRRMLDRCGYELVSVKSTHGSIGMSLLHVLGYENIGRMTARDILATALASLPFLPVLPFLHEFMFVVARKS